MHDVPLPVGPSTSCTTAPSASTCRPPCASPWPTSLGRLRPLRRPVLRRHPPVADRAGPRRQPAVPVLDPHRPDPEAGQGRGAVRTPPRTTGSTTARNRRYIDRNHGSILILWDRLFGTFEREDDAEPVIYGLTKNIHTDNPVTIATHEYRDILRDVAGSDNWAGPLLLRRSGARAGPTPATLSWTPTRSTTTSTTGHCRSGLMPYASGRTIHDADAHIMETPTWLRDHADPDIRDRIAPLDLSSGNELRQTGDPEEQLKDLVAAFDRLAAKHASEEYRADEAAEIMSRKNFAATGSFVAEDRPRALDLLGFSEPARLQHLPQPAPAQLGARQGRRAGHRRGPGPQPGHGRVLLRRRPSPAHLLRAAVRHRRRARPGRRGPGPGRGGAAHRLGLPARPLPQPRRARPGVGEGPGGGHPGRLPRRRHRRPDRAAATSRTACPSRPTSTAARRTSARSTTWASPTRPCRRWPR